MTPNQIFAEARHIFTDTDVDAPRQSNEELLKYLNAGLREACIIRPDLFITNGELACTPDTVEQGLSSTGEKALIDIIGIKGGAAVHRADIATLQAFRPSWRQDTAGAALNWLPYPGDARRFYIYPKAPTGQVLETKCVRNPAVIADSALDTEISELASTFHVALVHYIVARAESKDDEHVLSQRATTHYAAFVELMKAGTPQ